MRLRNSIFAFGLLLAACGGGSKGESTTPAANPCGANPCAAPAEGGETAPAEGGEANPCGGEANPCAPAEGGEAAPAEGGGW